MASGRKSFSDTSSSLPSPVESLSDRQRAILGAWLGAVMGAVYGLVSTTINALILPGLPVRVEAGDVVLQVLVGITALSFVNALRIATLVRLVEWQPTLFDYFHEYVWQGAFLMLVTVYAVAWVEWVRQ